MIQFTLPRPPSVNAMYRNVPGVGRVKTGDYKAWQRIAMIEMQIQRMGQTIPHPPVQITISLPNAPGRWDADNFIKAPVDCLKKMEIIPDDNRAVVRRILVEIGEHASGCIVTVEALTERVGVYGKVS